MIKEDKIISRRAAKSADAPAHNADVDATLRGRPRPLSPTLSGPLARSNENEEQENAERG